MGQIDPNIWALIDWVLGIGFALLAGWIICVTVWAITIWAGKWYEQVDREKDSIAAKVKTDTDLYKEMRELELAKAKALQEMDLRDEKMRREMALEKEQASHTLLTENLKGMKQDEEAGLVTPVVQIGHKAR